MTSFNVQKQIEINGSKEKVWDALVNPAIIKQYLFGTEAVSDWKVGSELIFQGEYDGNKYKDKGIIKKFDIEKTFQYTYLSSFSGLEDKEENYHLITFNIVDQHETTMLSLIHENIQNQQAKDHSENNWKMVLGTIKNILEGSSN